MAESKSMKVDAYIQGLSKNIKGEHAKDERILKGKKRKWENFQSGNSSGKVSSGSLLVYERSFTCHDGSYMIKCHKYGKGARSYEEPITKESQARRIGRSLWPSLSIKNADPQGLNVVTGTFLLNNRYASVLFYSDSDRSFVDTKFSSMLDIDPVKIDAGYECHKCGKVRHKARYCKEKNISTGANALPILTCYDYGEQGHTRNRCPKKVKQEEVGEVLGQAYAIKDAEPKGPNVVT
nr:reverse transcriptase domain-containing protein [Tanacetum cinerariifolium]